MTTIYLVRHAEAEGNLYRIAHGHYNSCITDDRGAASPGAGGRFRDVPVDAVYASDLIRTRTTAQSIYLPRDCSCTRIPPSGEICMEGTVGSCCGNCPQSTVSTTGWIAGRSPGSRRPGNAGSLPPGPAAGGPAT